MPLRKAITKVNTQGEQIVVDVCQWNPITGEILHTEQEFEAIFQDQLALVELRFYEMNMRSVEAYKLKEFCTPEEWAKVLDIAQWLGGMVELNSIASRWQAQKEENEDLARQRDEYSSLLAASTAQCMEETDYSYDEP